MCLLSAGTRPSSAPNGRCVVSEAAVVRGGPIAIIGTSCRLPGARDVQRFWRIVERARRHTEGPIP